MGVPSGPLRTQRVLRMLSIVSIGTPEAMPCLNTLSPAWRISQAIFAPAASTILRALSTHSGPMPSPGMRVTSFLPSGVVISAVLQIVGASDSGGMLYDNDWCKESVRRRPREHDRWQP